MKNASVGVTLRYVELRSGRREKLPPSTWRRMQPPSTWRRPTVGGRAPKGSKRVRKRVGIITIRFVWDFFFWSPDDKRRGTSIYHGTHLCTTGTSVWNWQLELVQGHEIRSKIRVQTTSEKFANPRYSFSKFRSTVTLRNLISGKCY